ncbi:MAG: class II fructose-bisphosphatase [Myxococcales bacterium]|nr:class II fructose-bisphosphatase [Myxococcota bacterium]MDW8281904.1 class II fructose-bisphosphatase [Myxococcales bacterium]
MDRNLAMELIRVTEAAALAAGRWMGRGDRKGADQAAVDAMRRAFDSVQVRGTVVIGEGERDEAPMLYIGEQVGAGWAHPERQAPRVDIAVDPLEGTNLCATGAPDAISVIAMAEDGKFLNAPDTYMEKIAVGPDARGAIDLRRSPSWNLSAVAEAKRCSVEDLTVIILDRDRHQELIAEVRKAGARIRLISDGDVSAAIATTKASTGIHVLMGIGGAPEGVLAAAAIRCVGGDMQARLRYRNDEERRRAERMGIRDHDRIYKLEDLAEGQVMFAATGVTDGSFLRGVRFFGGGATTHSVVMRSKSGTIRFIEAEHHFDRKPDYEWMTWVRPAPQRAS